MPGSYEQRRPPQFPRPVVPPVLQTIQTAIVEGDYDALDRVFAAEGIPEYSNIMLPNRRRPLSFAITHARMPHRLEMIRYLLENGANPYENDYAESQGTVMHTVKENNNALLVAVESNQPDVVELLLQAGVDPNYTESTNGKCALHIAVRENRGDIVEQLLRVGANPNALYQGGPGERYTYTPVELAQRRNFHEIEALLRSNGGTEKTPELLARNGVRRSRPEYHYDKYALTKSHINQKAKNRSTNLAIEDMLEAGLSQAAEYPMGGSPNNSEAAALVFEMLGRPSVAKRYKESNAKEQVKKLRSEANQRKAVNPQDGEIAKLESRANEIQGQINLMTKSKSNGFSYETGSPGAWGKTGPGHWKKTPRRRRMGRKQTRRL